MSEWMDFLNDVFGKNKQPGQVMICFMNRYLEGLDGIKYKIKYDGMERVGVTTDDNYSITLTPKSFNPIRIFVWSRTALVYKRLDDVVPELGKKKLVRKIMKSVRTEGNPKPVPKKADNPPPTKPAPGSSGSSPVGNQGQIPKEAKNENGQAQAAPLRPVPGQITVEQLRKIFPKNKGGNPSDGHLLAVADELNPNLPKYKLDTPFRRAHFFGQIKQESPLLDGAAESLNYPPEGLKATFDYYKKRPDEARQDGRIEEKAKDGKKKVIQVARQEVIANKAYGPDGNKGLGNDQPGDGWRFRGRGVHQTTGRANYDGFTKAYPKYWIENVDFLANSELVAQMPYSLRSAVVYWLEKKCWEKADGGINEAAIDAVTKIINAGEIRKHNAGQYPANQSPVLMRRKYVHLAYAAFT